MGSAPTSRPGDVSRARECFLAFYDEAVGPLFAYVCRATAGDRVLAEDICQDTFASALTQARAGNFDVLTIAWVTTVARNRLIDHWRRADREEQRLARLRLVRAPDPSSEIDGDVMSWLRVLPPMQRAAVVLRYVDDLSVEDVARHLGRGCKATESLLSRARQTLRSTTGPHHD